MLKNTFSKNRVERENSWELVYNRYLKLTWTLEINIDESTKHTKKYNLYLCDGKQGENHIHTVLKLPTES